MNGIDIVTAAMNPSGIGIREAVG